MIVTNEEWGLSVGGLVSFLGRTISQDQGYGHSSNTRMQYSPHDSRYTKKGTPNLIIGQSIMFSF